MYFLCLYDGFWDKIYGHNSHASVLWSNIISHFDFHATRPYDHTICVLLLQNCPTRTKCSFDAVFWLAIFFEYEFKVWAKKKLMTVRPNSTWCHAMLTLFKQSFKIMCKLPPLYKHLSSRDCMVVGFRTTYAIIAYHH